MPTKYAVPEEVKKTQLLSIIRGESTTIPRLRAITYLQQASTFTKKEKQKLYVTLLDKAEENPRIRHLAALGLYRMNKPKDTIAILKDSISKTQDSKVLCSIAQVMGRIGSEEHIDDVKKIAERTKGYVKRQANFAASQIAYRAGVKGFKLSFPKKEKLLTLSPNSRDISIDLEKPVSKEVNAVLQTLENESFGIPISKQGLFQVICQPSNWMIGINDNFSTLEKMKELQQRPALLGQYFLRNSEKKDYSTAFLIFSTPKQGGKLELLLKSPSGITHYAGIGKMEGDQLQFNIESVERPGASAIEFSGSFNSNNKFENLKTFSSAKVIDSQIPKQGV